VPFVVNLGMDKTNKNLLIKKEIITITAIIAVLLVLCLALPLLTQNVTTGWYRQYNQYIIGPLVNAALIFSALRLKKAYSVLPVVLVPSLCAATLGLIGISAVFMLYMVPLIWLGNMAITLSFRYLFKNYIAKATLGITLKVAIIFCGFLILRSFEVFPTPVAEMLFTMMGMVQLITATVGAIIAYGVVKLFR